MNLFFRQQIRGFLVTVLTAFLLIGAVGFSVIGYAAGEGARKQIEAIEARYMTVGFLGEQSCLPMVNPGWFSERTRLDYFDKIWQTKNYTRLEDGSIQWDDGTVYLSSAVVEAAALGAPQIISVNHSAMLRAHVEGMYGLSSAQANENQYNLSFDQHGTNFCVLLIRVQPRPVQPIPQEKLYDESGSVIFLSVQDLFDIQDVVSAHPYYTRRIRRSIGSYTFALEPTWTQSILTDEGEPALKDGKRYLLRCFYQDSPMLLGLHTDTEGNSTYGHFRYEHYDLSKHVAASHLSELYDRELNQACAPTTRLLDLHEDFRDTRGQAPENFALEYGKKIVPLVLADGKYVYEIPYLYYKVPDDSLPFFAEITGTVDGFLASEEGAVWRDVIIPMAEINQQSATVVLVDDLDYISGFSSGSSRVIDGRKPTPAEYRDGAKVCLVSTAYAKANGVTVGDSITLDYYDPGFFLTTGSVEMVTRTAYEMTTSYNPMQESNRIGVKQEYEIVGIYAAPEWEFGSQTFHADTIFVPKASVPNAEEYEDRSLPLLNSITILNGSGDQFEAYMEEQGFDNYYDFYDHDYSSNIAGFQAMELNARRLLLIGMVVLVITAILFYYLNFRRMVPVALTMRRLGQGRLCVWWQMISATVPLVLLAVLGGALAGIFGFDLVIDAILHAEMYLDVQAVVYMALAEAAVLTVPVLLISIPLSMPNMMKKE